MAACLFMISETDCKAANKYEYLEGVEPVYMKKLLRASRSIEDDDDVDEADEDDDDGSGTDGQGTGRQLCCCPGPCLDSCTCCCA